MERRDKTGKEEMPPSDRRVNVRAAHSKDLLQESGS